MSSRLGGEEEPCFANIFETDLLCFLCLMFWQEFSCFYFLMKVCTADVTLGSSYFSVGETKRHGKGGIKKRTL